MKKAIAVLILLLALTTNAQRNVSYDINLKGNKLLNAIINSFDNKATMDAFATSENYDNAHRGILASASDTSILYIWNGVIWKQVATLPEDIWRDATGTDIATGYTQNIKHNGEIVITNGTNEISLTENGIILKYGNNTVSITNNHINLNNKLFIPNN